MHISQSNKNEMLGNMMIHIMKTQANLCNSTSYCGNTLACSDIYCQIFPANNN